MKYLSFFLLSLFFTFNLSAQGQQYKVGCIGFYNLENLFDTVNDPKIKDEEFTPKGSKAWTKDLYEEKQDHLAQVVSEIATEFTPDGLAILGVSEVENRKVLEDFVVNSKIKDRNYQIIHYDSPDFRGIDVGLLYQPKYFKPIESKSLPLLIYNSDGSRRYTRDVLYVKGEFDGDIIHIMVNHWPSRSGGQSATQAYRNAGALLCKNVSDSLMQNNPNAKIIIMGDLNDDPSSPSVKKVIAAKNKKKKTSTGDFFNPMYDYFKKGIGTLAWNDAWNIFDQTLLSYGWLEKKSDGYHLLKAKIHNKKHLLQKSGRYKGYPWRTFSGDAYIGGFSDHFAVYVVVVKQI